MTMDFLDWLKGWLSRHPLRRPSEEPQASYTVRVMERIRASRSPGFGWGWLTRPRLALATGAAVAAWLVVVSVPRPMTPARMAKAVERDVQLLAQLNEDPSPILAALPGGLEQEAAWLERILLAEARDAADDEAWLEETLELLNAAGEDVPLPSGEDAADEWLRELELLDDQEITSS